MLANIFGVIVILLLCGLFAWLARRAWRSKVPVLKWGGTLLSGLLAVALLLAAGAALLGLAKVSARIDAPVPGLTVALTQENIRRGEHLADSFCTSCHSPSGDLPLTGGVDLGQDIAIPIGSFVSVNLTPAGPLKDWTDGEIFAALRNGVNRDGRALFMMSTARARYMSDEDTQAVIAYLRSQPAVVNETADPPDRINLLGLILVGTGMIPSDVTVITEPITAPPKAASVEYGEYILSFQDCRVCHGEDLKGGVEGQLAPIGWNLELVKNWTLDDFITTMRTGIDPNGYQLSDAMPWKATGRMDDVELEAMYLYLVDMP